MAEDKKSFGDFMVGLGAITSEQLKKAAQEQKQRGERLEQTIIRMGFAKEELVLQCLADYFNIPYVDLDTYLIDEKVVKMIPEEMARRHTLVPLFKIGNALTIALVNPLNLIALDEVRSRVKIDVEIAISTEKKIKKAIDQNYGASASAALESTLQQYTKSNTGGAQTEISDYKKTYDLVVKDLPTGPLDEAPAARMLDAVMIQAIRDRASDIHFEPDEKSLRVRFRIDGFLYESLSLPRQIHPSLTSRIKILSELDIAETRLPQDGNFNIKLEKRGFEIRVSTFPTIYGENVVLRVLDQTSPLYKLEELGFSQEMFNQFKELVRKTSGIILVTGPTGSGKTTTLYALLNMINSRGKNIITIEDPVEYRLDFIRQTQINPKAGITFASGLRSILRQDPDIIMIGEIRDLETADIAMQAALTGHLVLSTLHTNDAPEAISRLMDIGVEHYLISSSIIGVLAQRLVRTVCPDCKTPYSVDPKDLSHFGEEVSRLKEVLVLHRGKGCKNCKQSGFLGRTGIYELLLINEEIKRLISERASTQVIRDVGKKTSGLVPMRMDGLKKILKGVTTIEEVDRVAY